MAKAKRKRILESPPNSPPVKKGRPKELQDQLLTIKLIQFRPFLRTFLKMLKKTPLKEFNKTFLKSFFKKISATASAFPTPRTHLYFVFPPRSET
ncbi:hypothetical protein J4E81_003449 [Alternaria sp. BMP 2799]|nr:hypothetical protein J4E81_003449 [Alternaria sp. BMP 2799]